MSYSAFRFDFSSITRPRVFGVFKRAFPGVALLSFLCFASAGAIDGKPVHDHRAVRSHAPDMFKKVDRAVTTGELAPSEAAVLKLETALGVRPLPDEYQIDGARPPRCGFGIAHEIHRLQAGLSAGQFARAGSAQARPTTDTSVVSPAGHFRLHFDTVGVETVPTEDLDLNGIPDFIDRAGIYFDSAWDYYHTTLGYLTPPTDGVAGGDDKYDVYFLAILGYGATIFDGAGPAPWDDFQSYILMHRNFTGFAPNFDPEGSEIGALKVTAAHEYFHAVQLAYDGNDDLWLYESTATYNENRLFDEVDDNFQYLPFFYNDPDTFLTVSGGNRMYGSFVWPEYLTVNYGDSLMKSLWEELRWADGVGAYDSVLTPFGSSLAEEFQRFATWNFFTGDRDDGEHYPDGAGYPGIVFDRVFPPIPFTAEGAAQPPDGLANNYQALEIHSAPPGMLKLDFSGTPNVSWALSLIFRDTLGGYDVVDLMAPLSGLLSYTRYRYYDWDSLFIAPEVVSPFLNNNQYTITTTVLPHGDADGSGTLNIADVTYLIAYVFASGPEPENELLMGDADCNERINIADVTYLITHIFAGGPAPCSN